MKRYIEKDRILAEIEKLKGKVDDGSSYCNGWQQALRMLEMELATLETEEVDLEKETTHYLLYEHRSPLNEIMHKADIKAEMQYHKDIENAFKAGFELGLKSQKGE